MQNIVSFINLFFPALISIGIFKSKAQAENCALYDLSGYAAFVVSNLIITKIILIIFRVFVKYQFTLDGIEYTCVAFVVGLLLPYVALAVKTVFYGTIKIEKKQK